MNIILFDTKTRGRLFPLTLTRAVADVRIGILTMKERWEKITGAKIFVSTDSYLQPLYETIPPDNYVFIDASIIPSHEVIEKIINLSDTESISDGSSLIAGKVSIDFLPSVEELPGFLKMLL
jgi:hypothetical protein